MNGLRKQITRNVRTYQKLQKLNQQVYSAYSTAHLQQFKQISLNKNHTKFYFSEAKEEEGEKKEEKQEETKPETKAEELPDNFYKLLDMRSDAAISKAKQLFKKLEDQTFDQEKQIKETKSKLENTEKANVDVQSKIRNLRDTLKTQDDEMELVRKRLTKEKEEQKVYAISKFAKEMLDTADNLERALDNSKENKDFNTLFEGAEMTYANLMKSLERNQVKQVNPFKEKFDPNIHDCLMQVEDPKLEPGTVAFVIQSGYTIQDRCLRPAKVGVVKDRPQEQKKEEEKKE